MVYSDIDVLSNKNLEFFGSLVNTRNKKLKYLILLGDKIDINIKCDNKHYSELYILEEYWLDFENNE